MKSTAKYLAVVCAVTILLSVSAVAWAQPRAAQRPDRTVKRDMLVERMGLNAKQADKVIKIHERYAENIRKAEDKHRRHVEKIRKAEANDLAKIVGKERVGQVERLLRPPRLRLPFFGRQEPSVHGPKPAPPEYPGEGLDLRRLREWVRDLTDLTPEQRLKMKALMERYREQLKTLHEGFREKLNEILTSEQMERFRPPSEDNEQ